MHHFKIGGKEKANDVSWAYLELHGEVIQPELDQTGLPELIRCLGKCTRRSVLGRSGRACRLFASVFINSVHRNTRSDAAPDLAIIYKIHTRTLQWHCLPTASYPHGAQWFRMRFQREINHNSFYLISNRTKFSFGGFSRVLISNLMSKIVYPVIQCAL